MNRRDRAIFLGVLLIFFGNDIGFYFAQNDYLLFILVDYSLRLFAIAPFLLLWKRGVLRAEDMGLKSLSMESLLLWGVIFSAVGVTLHHVNWAIFRPTLQDWRLYSFPHYPSALARWLDLTFGTVLVAVSEEIVFRGWMIPALEKHMPSLLAALLSIVLFAGMHWGKGFYLTAYSGIWAVLPTLFFLRYRSIYPLIIAHFALDFYVYYS